MKWVPDTTRRFSQRPHYELAELDHECEVIITSLLQQHLGKVAFPVPTDTLTKLIERDARDLDLYADLSKEGPEVEGVTDFYPKQKPRVRIAKELSEQAWRGHRLRTTLSHEYGHVKFHAPLWDGEFTPSLFPESADDRSPKCRRETILTAGPTDWMEWQAGYVCGALLMPISAVREVAEGHLKNVRAPSALRVDSLEARSLVAKIAGHFDVSEDAARVRLLKLGWVTTEKSLSLFARP